MLFYLLSIILLAGCIAIAIWGFFRDKLIQGIIFLGSLVLAVILAIFVLASSYYVISNKVLNDSQYEAALAEKAVLEWRLEQNYIDNDNNLGATELYRDVQEFNSNLAKAKSLRSSIWTNWYAYEFTEHLDPIQLP